MKVTISFTNPFLVMLYTASILMIGWAIGAYWGHTLTAGWMLLFATTFLLLHDAAIALLLAAWAIKTTGKSQEHDLVRATAESSGPGHEEPPSESAASGDFYPISAYQDRRSPQEWLDLPIEEMEFSVRTHNRLKTVGIQTVRELAQCSEGDLIDARLSPVSLNEIKVILGVAGLKLRLDSQEEEDE